MFWVGGLLVFQGQFTIGTIVAFTAYLGMLYGPLSALTNARMDISASLVSFERVFEVLGPAAGDPGEAGRAQAGDGSQGQRAVSGRVSFSYQPGESVPGATAAGLSEVSRFAWGGHGMDVPLSQEGGKLEKRRAGAAEERRSRMQTRAQRPSSLRRFQRWMPRAMTQAPFRRRAGRSATSPLRSSPGNWPRSSARAAQARPRSPTCCPASTTRPAARSASTVTTCAI